MTGSLQWMKRYPLAIGRYKSIQQIELSSDGSIYTVGTYTPPATMNVRAYVSKYDSTGNVIWSRYSSYLDSANRIRPTADGGLLVCYGTYGTNAQITKFASNGTVEWVTTTRNTVGIYRDGASDMTVLEDGSILSMGYAISSSGAPTSYAVLTKLSPQGQVLWSKVGNIQGLTFLAQAIAPDGDLVYAGYFYPQGGNNFFVMKTSQEGKVF